MTISSSTKIRTFGGASALALTMGLSAAASAQVNAPVQTTPTPAVPAAPANVEECVLITTVTPPEVRCAPGTDPDGFQEPFNSIDLTVEAGSQVQGELNLLVGANVTIDGDVVSNGRAVDVGAASTVVNNGFISTTNTPLSGLIRTGDGSNIINNGIITSSQSNHGGIETNSNSIVTNNGEISLTGFGVIGISGTGSVSAFGSDQGTTVNNSLTGKIIIQQGIAGIFLGNGATVSNDGLVQTFGALSDAVIVGNDSSVMNNGFLFTIGDGAEGIRAGSNANIVNTGGGRIFTFGDNAAGVQAGNGSRVQNNGLISTDGAGAEAVRILGDGTVQNNGSGQLVTDGDDSNAVQIAGNGTVINSFGLIQATGDGSDGVAIDGDGELQNSGTITSALGRAVDIGGVATITNFQTGVISSKGDDGIRVDTDGATITNFGVIESDDDEAIEASGINNVTVVNNGIIRATANGDKGIEAEENLTITNTGLIFSQTSEAIEADAGGLVLINSGQIISPLDDAVDGDDDVMIMNSGLIQGGENDGLELNSGMIINSGTIESLSSDPNGDPILAGIGAGQMEIDAAIDFDGGNGNEDGTVLNLETGLIIGDIGINTSSGATGSDSNDGSQVVTNLGSIVSRGVNPETGRMDAVLLGNGDDTFIQANDGSQTGWVDGGAGTDVFAYLITDATDRSFDLSGPIAGFEDIRIGSQNIDIVAGTLAMQPVVGTVTLTGTANQGISIVNTAILDGTVNGTVTHIEGANTNIASAVTITGNGAIATTADGEIGFTSGDGVTLTNGGAITTAGMNTAAVVMGMGSTLDNTGRILSTGTNGVGVALGGGSSLTNAAGATITTDGDNGFGVIISGDGTVTNAGIIATNGATAQAITITGAANINNSGLIAAAGGRAIDVALASTITNNMGGTIASRGGDAIRLNAAMSTVTNAGDIITEGDGNVGVRGVADSSVSNSGAITTSGDSTAAVLLGDNAMLTNTGRIQSTGVNGVGAILGDGSTLSNAAGATLTTDGDNGFGVIISGDGTVLNDGIIATNGATAQAITINGEALIVNNGLIAAAGGRAIDVALASIIANSDTGTIASRGGDAIRMNASMSTTSNAGTILTEGDGNIGVVGVADSTVNNSGTISTAGDTTSAIVLGDNGTVNNRGTISSSGTNSLAVALGDGGSILNVQGGTITTSGDNAPTVLIGGNGTITNEATISATGAGSQAVTITGDATITNSGTISGADGRAIDVAGVATIDNAAGGTITATGADAIRLNSGSTVTNAGTISGDVAISGSIGDDTVINSGTLTGAMTAVALADGNDVFTLMMGGTVNGGVMLGAGDDTFNLTGATSGVTGLIDGGTGNDIAVINGTLDSDNLANFAQVQFGNVDISGARNLTDDVTLTGATTADLGVDSLRTTGAVTLENTATITIATPLDAALIGQNVSVIRGSGGVTDNGATINILDDDLLIDYTVVAPLIVRVSAANPIAGNPDPNINRFGAALSRGVAAGTLSGANFATLNALGNASALSQAAVDAMPSLSDGVGREIFESGSLASQALARHLQGEESGIWGQIAVRGAEQDALSASADGYDANQTVFTAGGDFAVAEGARVGFLASYADIGVDDENATGAPGSIADVESIRLGLYAAVNLGERGFVNTELSYLTGEVESARSGILGPISSAYDFDGVAARVTVGWDILPDENVWLTPTFGLNAARIEFDTTTEAGGLGFTVNRGDAVYVEGRLGVELGSQISEKVSGFISGTAIHDVIDDPRSFILTSAQVPSFVASLPQREQDRFELSAGASIEVSESASIEIGYLGDFNSGYSGHSARASVRIAF